ncbi:hypothetical protein BD311DRAFT_765751 [Dichomitus squalens]|uniref:Uncharacterized protein n=1 Tax=Dichomitus squalens TaxID=114155 RepID=A0A4Q9MCB8_9APHY|nr:hypothetical protein BD311DRAFT_765751 [Dichomitus squalens]
MVILDEKALMLPPPPPYVEAGPVSPPPFPTQHRPPLTLVTLPPHILLRVVYETFSQGRVEKQRKVLYWLTLSLRLVNRAMYIACMHVLRSTYLPLYTSLIRSPYTSDPFPHAASGTSSLASTSASATSSSPADTSQREMRVLDLFIALKVREDVWTDDSELHLEREESFKDLFDLLQPRARLEDLVHHYGARDGVIAVPLSSGLTPVATTPISSPTKKSFGKDAGKIRGSSSSGTVAPIPFAALTASFSPRAVGLVLTTKERKRKIVEVPRARDETLEVSAKKLVRELKGWLASNPNHGVR